MSTGEPHQITALPGDLRGGSETAKDRLLTLDWQNRAHFFAAVAREMRLHRAQRAGNRGSARHFCRDARARLEFREGMAVRSASRLMSRLGATLLAALAAIAVDGCRARPDPPPKPATSSVAWHKLGQWSGRGNLQTESFTSDTGVLRVRWETTPEASGAAPAGPEAFHLTAHSAISGRPLQDVVDQTGPGSGVGYVQQDPHVFYVVVDSTHLRWRFTVEEAIGYP